MVNPQKRKGTAAEVAVVGALIEAGWPYAERRALAGVQDKGDIAGVAGVVLEVKSHKTYSFQAWLREAKAEQENANAAHAVVVAKPNGVGATRVGEWFFVMRLEDGLRLLKEAGY